MAQRSSSLPDHPNCLNCGAELRGQYCGNCGQRALNRLISLWELLRDAFGDLFELDSRLWRTLIPLLIRPGRLTLDYLEGRRARYMPPFRMYLVLSLIFFVVAFFDPRDDLKLLFEPPPETAAEQAEAADAASEDAEQHAREILEELEAEGIITTTDHADSEKDWAITIFDSGTGAAVNPDVDEETGRCSLDLERYEEMPGWFKRRLTTDRLVSLCERFQNEGPRILADPLLDNIPVALIVLMPIMALVLKALYPLSRRYFVEHLLFFLHYHSFFFLILTLQIVFARFADLVSLPEVAKVLPIVAAAFYIPVYLYKSMRLVYAQGHIFTLAKYVLLVFAYTIGATLTMLGALLFALVSV